MTGEEALVRALLDPAAWPHPVDAPRLVETHISWVVLTGEYAYKIKKPLELEFLDFSTLEKRRHWCEEELRLNSRWAPTLYLEVVPIAGSSREPRVGGDGTPIEYAVRMRQFPQSALLSEQLAAGRLDADDMLELAGMIAERHAHAPVNRETRFGSPGAIRKPMLENFDALRPWLDGDALALLEEWTEDELGRLRGRMRSRRQDGFVRECHGDLHLRNLVRLDDGIVAFDCIEFNDELRMLDVVSDLSFVTMDLVAAGRRDLAWTLLNRYLEVSGDYAGMRVYGLYFVYHCLIRAKVAAIRASERDDGDDQASDLETMRHYCGVARDWIARPGPALVLMHGFSGSGKTWVSSRLLADLGAIRIRSDIERKRMHGLAERASSESAPGEGLYDRDGKTATYARLRDLAGELLAGGHRVILDASFLDAGERQRARAIAADHGMPSVLVTVAAPQDVLESRLEARRSHEGDASEADTAVLDYQQRHADPIDDKAEGPVIHFESRDEADTDDLADRVRRHLRGS